MKVRLALALLCLAGLIGAAESTEPATSPVLTPPEHRRGADQTFLTFPEWYLVHSPAEYAAYLQDHLPSRFPLFAHIGQFWQSYAAVAREIRDAPFNGGYHLMISVIGTSTTVEYGLKGLYEHTIGRIGEAFAPSRGKLREDALAARFAQEYVDFIRVDPWYLFDFESRLAELWHEPPLSGPGLVRRWERLYALTTEYAIKAGYARLIKLATHSIYDAPLPTTAVAFEPALDDAMANRIGLEPLAASPPGVTLGLLPRYDGFTQSMRRAAAQPSRLTEIAGNRGEILVSLITPSAWSQDTVALRPLFEQPILTTPGRQRRVVAVPVRSLVDLMRLEGGGVVVEHVYDY
ncbi:hypothetical protein BH09PSE6_BH09PSE6_20600 [soil metagenome]